MLYSNKNIFRVLRLYLLILIPSALLFKEQSHEKISLFAKSFFNQNSSLTLSLPEEFTQLTKTSTSKRRQQWQIM